jgi:glycosyltransferase involved in cell wall biosynthesis
MHQPPTVSIVMSVYNGTPFLREAIESILSQTFSDFEFIIINDGSSDESETVIQSYQDARIRYVPQENNSGLAASLNHGLTLATGTYIARMDSDDICVATRLEEQVAFLNTHTDIGVIGTWAQTFGESSFVWKNPTAPQDIAARLLFSSCLLHPTVMLRAAVLIAANVRYDDTLRSAQDYALWVALLPHTKFANLPKVLLHYRLSPTAISATRRTEQLANTWRTQAALLSELNLPITEDSQRLHTGLAPDEPMLHAGHIAKKAAWLMRIRSANTTRKLFSENALEKVLHAVWWETCTQPPVSIRSLYTCLRHPLFISSIRAWIKVIFVAIKIFRSANVSKTNRF